MTGTRIARALLPAALVVIPLACDSSGGGDGGEQAGRHLSLGMVVWGCDYAIPSKVEKLDPRRRDEVVAVEDFALDRTVTLRDAWRRDERADLELKLPVTIEGHTKATVWIPRHERDRVALILSDVPRSGAGNSYRIEDGHQAVRFEPCTDRTWTSWTAGLALADRRRVVLWVKVDDAPRAARVTIGARSVVASDLS